MKLWAVLKPKARGPGVQLVCLLGTTMILISVY